VVDTVRVEVPTPLATVIALKLHAGAGLVAGRMLLQLSCTVDGSSPPNGVMVMVELLEAPAPTDGGESDEALRVNAGVTLTTWFITGEVLEAKLLSPP